MHRLLLYALVALLCFSCRSKFSENEVRTMMGDWYKKKIKFPEGLNLINPNSTDSRLSAAPGDTSGYQVIHFFTADCDKCINELKVAQRWIEKHPDQKNMKFIFIASGPTQVYAQEAIQRSGFRLPVYFEKDYFSFKRINGLPLPDQLYDTMLVNSKGEVLLFGALFDNDKAEDLYLKIVNSGI